MGQPYLVLINTIAVSSYIEGCYQPEMNQKTARLANGRNEKVHEVQAVFRHSSGYLYIYTLYG